MMNKLKSIFESGMLWGYLFVGILAFTKGVGLDSSNKIYAVLLFLSLIVLFIFFCKGSHTKKQIILLICMMIPITISMLISHKFALFLAVLISLSLGNMNLSDIKKLLKVYLVVLGICFLVMFLMGIFGLKGEVRYSNNKGDIYNVGYVTGNIFHATFAIISICTLYLCKKEYPYMSIVLFLINIAVYYFSKSRAGLIMVIVAIFFFGFEKVFSGNIKIMKITTLILGVSCIILVACSFILPIIYGKNHDETTLIYKLNSLLSTRISLMSSTISEGEWTLFGKRELTYFLDNTFMFIMFQYGIIPFAIVCSLYSVAYYKLVKMSDYKTCILIFVFVLYGFAEQFFVNPIMNFSWMLIGSAILFDNRVNKKKGGAIH